MVRKIWNMIHTQLYTQLYSYFSNYTAHQNFVCSNGRARAIEATKIKSDFYVSMWWDTPPREGVQ